jgi:hypothetical protein
MLTSTNPALTAYKVYHLSQMKLDNECRRQTPDLHRIVAHASIVDNIRRWSREVSEPLETVLVDSASDTDSDPFEDPASDEDSEDPSTFGQVSVYDDDMEDHAQLQSYEADDNTTVHTIPLDDTQQTSEDDRKSKSKSTIPRPNRQPPPPPSIYEYKSQTWRQNRPILVKETAIEVDEDD